MLKASINTCEINVIGPICNCCFLSFFLQLYEINDDPKRKEFLDDLFLFMQKRGKFFFNLK